MIAKVFLNSSTSFHLHWCHSNSNRYYCSLGLLEKASVFSYAFHCSTTVAYNMEARDIAQGFKCLLASTRPWVQCPIPNSKMQTKNSPKHNMYVLLVTAKMKFQKDGSGFTILLKICKFLHIFLYLKLSSHALPVLSSAWCLSTYHTELGEVLGCFTHFSDWFYLCIWKCYSFLPVMCSSDSFLCQLFLSLTLQLQHSPSRRLIPKGIEINANIHHYFLSEC